MAATTTETYLSAILVQVPGAHTLYEYLKVNEGSRVPDREGQGVGRLRLEAKHCSKETSRRSSSFRGTRLLA